MLLWETITDPKRNVPDILCQTYFPPLSHAWHMTQASMFDLHHSTWWGRPPSKYLEKISLCKEFKVLSLCVPYLFIPKPRNKAGLTHRLFLWGDICASGKTSSPEAPLPPASPSHQDHAWAASTENRMLTAALIPSKLPLYPLLPHPSQTLRKKVVSIFIHSTLSSKHLSFKATQIQWLTVMNYKDIPTLGNSEGSS